MPISGGGKFSPDPNIVSPGVFTREINVSGVAQGISNIGGAVVAPFKQGPGFYPTLVNSMAQLQSIFGIPDGTLYGPYTAQQYLQQEGFVTVCRVGALTGYHQEYPWFIWAESGQWSRNPDTASVVAASSVISSTGLTFSTTGMNSITTSSFGYTGSIVFTNQPVSLLLSGSLLYNGTTVQGTISGFFSFTGSLNLSTASVTSASILNEIINENQFTGSLSQIPGVAYFSSTQDPFDFNVSLVSPYLSQSIGACAVQELNVGGFLEGGLGYYNGQFVSGSGVFNSCTGEWTMNTQFKVLAVLANTQYTPINTSLIAAGFLGSTQSYNPSPSGSNQVLLDFNLALTSSGDGGYGIYGFSLDPNDPKYIKNVFTSNPQAGNPEDHAAGTKIDAAYIYSIFEDDIALIATAPDKWRVWGTAMPSGSWTGEALNFTDQWSLNPTEGDSTFSLTNATTPWVISQEIAPFNGGSPTRFPLFQLATLSDGTYTNTSYKVEISNVRLAGTVAGSDWGTFSLILRQYSDTDRSPSILEQYDNLTLNPNDPNFISRRIGDMFSYIRFDGKIIQFGTYSNVSNYIRVIIAPNPVPETAVPYGFQAYSTPVNGALGQQCAPIAYSMASVYGISPGKYPSGVDFQGPPTNADVELTALYPTSSTGQFCWRNNQQYFAPVPAGSTVGFNTIFALDAGITASGVFTGSYIEGTNIVPAIFDAANETTYVKMRSFVFGFQGGFDGQSPAIPLNIGSDITAGNTQGLNCASSTTAGSVAYNQCINALGNPDEFDINLIVTPGIIYSLHSFVTTAVIDMCTNRGDCFYVADLYQDEGNPASGQIDQVVSLASEFDTSYAATYYPWIKIIDTNINQIVTVPPSVVMPAVYAANDQVAGEWYAPAGLNRGGIPQAVQVTDRTTHLERDTLYEGRVNPIAAFPGQGIVVWGQKTLQLADDATNRVNVRRLLINIKKFFASTARFLVFEQNTATTWNKFLAIVNPYLESIQQRQGLYAFKVIMDSSVNTPDLIDQNILYGKIYLQPTKSAEFILFDFQILPTGAVFPNS